MAGLRSAALPTLREILVRVHLRVVLFSVMLAAASVTLSGGLVIRKYAEHNLDLMARAVAAAIEPAVAFRDRAAIVTKVASVADSGSVQQIDVLDRAGHLLAHWRNPRAAQPRWLSQSAKLLPLRRAAVVPLLRGGSQIGVVRIIGNAEGLVRFVISAAFIALSTLVLTLIAGAILARRLHSHVIGPIEHVAAVADAVRSERLFNQRVQGGGIAEIDRLGRHFNALVAELQAHHDSKGAADEGGKR